MNASSARGIDAFLASMPIVGQLTGSDVRYANYLNQLATRQAQEFSQNSARQAMQFSADEAQKNRDFQAALSNSAYTRAMADMRSAGLNPILAYTQGGASTPGGAMGTGYATSSSASKVDKYGSGADVLTDVMGLAVQALNVGASLAM